MALTAWVVVLGARHQPPVSRAATNCNDLLTTLSAGTPTPRAAGGLLGPRPAAPDTYASGDRGPQVLRPTPVSFANRAGRLVPVFENVEPRLDLVAFAPDAA